MYSHTKEGQHSTLTEGARQTARICRHHGWPSGLLVLLIATLIHLFAAIGAEASGRVALVLACENYDSFKASTITAKWARDLGEALKAQNLDVTVAVNSKDAEARAALREFALKSEQADFALIVVGGHTVAYQGQSFFLPQNARIQRATDLFSRGLSLASIGDIAGKAKSAAVLMLMTVPDISSPVPEIDPRPAANRLQAANVVTVFSSSPKVPVSGVDRVSEQAAQKLLDTAREKPLILASLVKSASADGAGLIVGEVPSVNLSVPLESAAPADGPRTDILEAAARAQAEAERKAYEASIARDQAEKRARDAEQRARDAQEEAGKVSSLGSIQSMENALTTNQRIQVQRRLQELRLYRGNADAVFGDQTRQAIMQFQRLSGAPETGYLTRSQYEWLINAR